MAGLGWYIVHEGKRLERATKRAAHNLAQRIADETRAAVTVRPITRRKPKAKPAAAPARRTISARSNPAGFHNLEASGFRRGEYVGYSEGRIYRVKKRPGGGWVAGETVGGRDAGKGFVYGRTLAEISAKLAGAMTRNPDRGDDWTGVRCWATINPRTGKVMTTSAYKAQALEHARKWNFDVLPAHYEAGKLILDSYKKNPIDLGGLPPAYFLAEQKARRGRLDYIAATKGRRLAKSLGRRGGSPKEAAAQKTGKFAVDFRGKINGVTQSATLYRASRSAADNLAANMSAAGYTVSVREI
jgi:hypothetical protein